MVLAAALPKSIAMWMKLARASGTRFMNASFRMGREEKLLEVLPPLDWNKVGGETWGDVVAPGSKGGHEKCRFRDADSAMPHKRTETWDSVFQPVRQPDWWKGDAEYHPPAIANRSPSWSAA